MNRVASTSEDREDLERTSKQMECRRRDRAPKALIVLDDDDGGNGDVQILSASSSSFAQARSSVANRSGRFTEINLEDLELQIVSAGAGMSFGRGEPLKNHNPSHEHKALSHKGLVDLTTSNDECQLITSIVSKKRKPAPSIGVKEMKLSCAICLGNMKEETTTRCGHVFCKTCIVRAIQVYKQCPSCRKKLTLKNIHRIYISGST